MTQYKRPKGLNYLAIPLEMLEKDYTLTEAFVYAYMLNRWGFFQRHGGEFFENIEVIAQNTGHSPATIKRAVKRLKDTRLVEVFTKKAKIGNSNSYVVHDVYGSKRAKGAPEEPQGDVPWEG